MARRTPSTIAVLAALGLTAALLISGCASGSTGGTHGSTPAPGTTTGAPSTPTPTPTPTFVAKQYTCTTILPPATLGVFQSKKSAGFALRPDYTQRVHNFSADLSQFSDWGGILCQWAYTNAEDGVDYGFSAITAQQTTTEQASLSQNGYEPTPKYHGTEYVNTDTKDFPDVYLFINGYWFFASSDKVLSLIADNVFQTPGQ